MTAHNPNSPNRPVAPRAASTDAPAKPNLSVVLLEDRVVPAGQVLGTVFLDFNANGLLDAAGTLPNAGTGSTPTLAEPGVAGVIVTAFDAANAPQGTATTSLTGAYTLTMTGNGPYRLEFTNLPANTFTGPEATGVGASGTSVRFVGDGNTANVNLSVVDPRQTSATNPTLLTNRYIVGEVNEETIVAFPYSSGTEVTDPADANYLLNSPTVLATNGQIGATWGLAFNPANNTVYAAAFTKRHTAYGPGGPGAIYALSPTGAAAPTLFADLNALTGNAAAGANLRPALGTGYDYTDDMAVFDAVGKSGLGGVAVDETGTFLYTVGLADRRLYRVRIPADGSSPTLADLTSFALPLPTGPNGVTGITGPNPQGDLRPFAVEFFNGRVYVGATNSAESTGLDSDLRAFVFAFDPAANAGTGGFVNLAGTATSTESVLTQSLNYPRGHAHPGDRNPPNASTVLSAEWNAWSPTRITLANITPAGADPFERYAVYPQALLTGLTFDTSGNMVLGVRDRNADQYGNFLTFDFAGTPNPGTKGIAGGDTLRAAIVTPGDFTSGWTPENITAAPPTNITGPTAGGQFFWQQDLPPNGFPAYSDHQAIGSGGVLQLPGRSQIAVTVFDPIRLPGRYDLGGIRWYDTEGVNAGATNKAYVVYQNTPTTFAKSNGIGDLIAATPLGREIGNRVWLDDNGNGRQDPGEGGIQNVEVVLVSVTGGTVTPVSTATTDANGNYYFSSYSGVSTSNKRFGIAELGLAIPAGTSYEVRIPVSNPALAGLQSTDDLAAGTNAQNDSNGVLTGTNYVISNAVPQPLGASFHSNDVGFLVANSSLSGFVYEDTNPSNSLNAGDVAIPGVTVVLTGVTTGGTPVTLTATTIADGSYSFTGLLAGTYTVTQTQPAGYINRGEQPGSTGGTAPQNGTVISAIPLAAGQASTDNNFGEVRPAQLSGVVYHDINNDGTLNAGDVGLDGVTVVLTGVNDLGATITPVTSTTTGGGTYAFTNLRPGTYSVAETQPAGFTTRTNNPGTAFTPGTGTAGTVVADSIQGVVLNSNANNPANNFGEVLVAGGQLSGFVYEDNDRSSTFNLGDTPIVGATLVLTGTLTAGGTSITPRTSVTDANGAYSFGSLQPGSYTVTETQPAGLLDFNDQIGSTGGNVNNDILSAIPIDNAANSNSVNNNFGEVRPAQLSGVVYHDINNDGTLNAGDVGLDGVTVVLTGVNDLGATITPVTSTTTGGGTYAFTNLRPGTYSVAETQPAGFTTRTNNPGTAFTPGTGTAGTVVADSIQTIRLNSNANNPANNFGEIFTPSAQLSGFVYIDANNDGTFQGSEAPIAGATVILTGTQAAGGASITPVTTTTDVNGAYSFTNLLPGTYSVQELQPTTPANLITGRNTAGTATNGTPGTAGNVGDDNIRNVVLNPFGNSPSNNFGEIFSAQLAGAVYEDLNNDGTLNAGDAPLSNVTLVLTGTNDLGAIAPLTATTALDGTYSFGNLRPGTYTVSETQPAGFVTRTNTAGATTNGTPGTVSGDSVQTIGLNPGGDSPGNNFGEVRLAQLSGNVYHDINDDGTFNSGDLGLAGVTVVLTGTNDQGAITPATTTTAPDGSYSFTGLRPGTYTVSETQPPVFVNRTNNPGTTFTPGTGTAGTVVADTIAGIVLQSNANNPANNFGEVLPSTASIGGVVYEDVNNSNSFTNGIDTPLGGVTVVLSGTLSTGGTLTPRTTTTANDGTYAFTNLQPGTYTVTETQPPDFLNRGEQPGTTGGTAPQNGTVISAIPLAAGEASVSNNFGEVRPVSVSGNVYHDINDNGVFDDGDALIPNTTLTLTGTDDLGSPVTATQVSGGGFYSFTGLRPGTYTVAETQPPEFITRTNNAGTVVNGTPGTVVADTIQTIAMNSGGSSSNNNFGERLLASSLSGFVFFDPNLNGVREVGEIGIANVNVQLFREDGPGILTPVAVARTDSNGFYEFTNLPRGIYRVVETQPPGYPYSTIDTPGTTGGVAGGNNSIASISLPGGVSSVNNNFGETKRTNLFGYVWVDTNRNGIFDPGEAPVPGAVVNINGTAFAGSTIAQQLTAGLASGPLTSITDVNGRWEFNQLPPGNYGLVQTNTPVGLQDFRSQNASGKQVQTSTATTFGGVAAQNPAEGPLNFGKVAENGAIIGAVEPSKLNFLGSSALTTTATANPLVGPPTVTVNTNPPFGIRASSTGGPTYVAVGAGAGFSPIVRVFDYTNQVEAFRFQAFENGMTAGVRVTTADITGDGTPDIIAAAGPGVGPRVRVFDGVTGSPIRDFFAFPPNFRGGLYVAAADFNGDGRADIVAGAGEGGGPNVRVFDGATGTLLTSFFAFDSSQTGGARIAVGDFNGDGTPDIAASNGPGNTSLVRVFSGRGFGPISQFTPYSSTYSGGVFLSAGDVDGDGRVDLVTGADQGGGPNVRIFNATNGQLKGSFFAYESSFTGGVRVTVRDVTGDGRADIITGAGLGGASRLRIFSGANLQPVEEFFAFDSGIRTGIFLG